MNTVKFTICSYGGQGARQGIPVDFAVIVVSENEAVLIGTDLRDMGLESDHPVIRGVFESTIELLDRRIREHLPGSKTGFDILGRLVSDNFSSITYGPVQEFKTLNSVLEVATDLYAETVEGCKSIRLPDQSIGTAWFESVPSQMRRMHIADGQNSLFTPPVCIGA